MRRCHIVYGQDAGEDRVLVYLNGGLILELVTQLAIVLGPGDYQRLVALAARAHQLGAHSLGNIVFEVKRRYPGRHCMVVGEIQFAHHHHRHQIIVINIIPSTVSLDGCLVSKGSDIYSMRVLYRVSSCRDLVLPHPARVSQEAENVRPVFLFYCIIMRGI